MRLSWDCYSGFLLFLDFTYKCGIIFINILISVQIFNLFICVETDRSGGYPALIHFCKKLGEKLKRFIKVACLHLISLSSFQWLFV